MHAELKVQREGSGLCGIGEQLLFLFPRWELLSYAPDLDYSVSICKYTHFILIGKTFEQLFVLNFVYNLSCFVRYFRYANIQIIYETRNFLAYFFSGYFMGAKKIAYKNFMG
jgi:hypothetical protein